MKQINIVIESSHQLDEQIKSGAISTEIHSAKSILVQIFSDRPDLDEFIRIVEAVKSAIPGAVVIGATSAGGISNGRLIVNAVMLSFSFYYDAELIPVSFPCHFGEEYETGTKIAAALECVPHLKGILLLANPILVNCASVLNGIHDRLGDMIVFGGGAAGMDQQNGLVFQNDSSYTDGAVVAVGLAGEELYIESTTLSGWKTLGPEMTLTDVDGFDVIKINGKPAFDVFSRYFRLKPEDDLFLLEFPLLIERKGTTLARNPISSGVDGRLSLIADIYPGEKARLGYLDVDIVIDGIKTAVGVMERFCPETIFLYSCICRRFALQQDVEIETIPFNLLAPASGFFTYGEFCKTDNGLEVLNSSEIVVGVREGAPKTSVHVTTKSIENEVDHYSVRHIQVTSRLFQFISSLTDELEEANRALQFQADHDPLTGANNRQSLDQNINDEIFYSKMHGHQLSFILMDIDFFKKINDQFGHLAGDYALRCITQAVAELTRTKDVLYRYGGEEFLLMLPETSLDGALVVAEKTRRAIASMKLSYNEISLPVITASLGVACYPEHGDNAETIISILDQALYKSKDSGRNIISIGNKKCEG